MTITYKNSADEITVGQAMKLLFLSTKQVYELLAAIAKGLQLEPQPEPEPQEKEADK